MANKGGNFLTGFTFGILAGAAGFYLYGTKQGEKVRGQIRDEFKRVYDAIPEEEKKAYPDSIRGSIKYFFDSVFLDLTQSTEESIKTKAKNQVKTPSMATKTSKKFKKFKNTKKTG